MTEIYLKFLFTHYRLFGNAPVYDRPDKAHRFRTIVRVLLLLSLFDVGKRTAFEALVGSTPSGIY